MKFFKNAIKYSSTVLSPAAAVWALTYSIPNSVISNLPDNSTYVQNYNEEQHAIIGFLSFSISLILFNVYFVSERGACRKDKNKSMVNVNYSEEASDEEQPNEITNLLNQSHRVGFIGK